MKILGKHIADHFYLHISFLDALDTVWHEQVDAAEILAGVRREQDFNVVKFSKSSARLTLLDYPGFFEQGFPTLRRYWTVDIAAQKVQFRTYDGSLNPPILHRKELLLPPDNPHQSAFAELTAAAEKLGLFDDTTRIGFQQAWEKRVADVGYQVLGHALIPLGNDEAPNEADTTYTDVARHLTALRRYSFSAPMQTLARFGFLDGSKTVFDYGC